MEPIKRTYWSCNTPDCEEGHKTYEEAVMCVLENAGIHEYDDDDFLCPYCGRQYFDSSCAKTCCSVEALSQSIRCYVACREDALADGAQRIASRFDSFIAGYEQRLSHRLAMDAKGE